MGVLRHPRGKANPARHRPSQALERHTPAYRTEDRRNSRLLIFGLLATLWLLLILVRLVDLQVRQSDRFALKAQQQQEGVIEVQATRGAIYDLYGEDLALSTPVDSIGVFPSKVRNPQLTAPLLAEVLRVDRRALAEKLHRKRFQWVKRLAEPGEAERARNLGLSGIHFEKESKRYYPKGTVASNILGAVGVDHQGQAGLEQSFDALLQGESGQQLVQYDALRQHYDSRTIKEPVPGADLVLTIDQRVQVMAEAELRRAIEQTQSVSGTVVVMDPNRGDLLALANWPTFDPNDRVRNPRDLDLRRNYAVSNLIEPGSTFKIVTVAAALEENLTSPEELIDCQMGAITLGRRRIRDHKPYGVLTVSEVLSNSSNVGAIKLALRLEPKRLLEYIRRFGFGEATGLPLPGEIDGLVRSLDEWKPASIGSIAIGQEVGVTAIQMTRALAALANGGLLVQPRLVEAVIHPDGRRQLLDPAPPKRILSSKTSAIMRAMLEQVVTQGTGRMARTPGYRVGGKTGTAQKIDPETGTYSPSAHIASFVGLAPINDPSIVVAVVLDSPVGEHYGGQVAAPVFPRVVLQTLRFLDVPPELPLQPAGPRPSVPADQLVDFAAEPADQPMPPRPAGDSAGNEVLVAASGNRAAVSNEFATGSSEEVVLLVTDRVVPDFRGRTVRQVLAQTTQLGLQVDLRGHGIVRQQWPTAGTPVMPGAIVKLEFADFEGAAAKR